MNFLIRTFLITCALLAAVLLWWRPPAFLVSAQPVDWALRYEKQHTPIEMQWGMIEMAREFIRASEKHLPLTEFIHENMDGELIRAEGKKWRMWYEENFSDTRRFDETDPNPVFFRPSEPLISELEPEHGYIEIREPRAIHFLFFKKVPARDFENEPIPSDLLYPFRSYSAAALAAALTLAVLGGLGFKKEDLIAESTAGLGCKAMLAILLSGVALIILPFFYHIIEDSPPFVFLGGFLVLCGIIGLGLFLFQAARLKKILDGEDRLAHWTYNSDQWYRFATWEYGMEKSEKMGLLLLVSTIILGIGLVFWIAVRDEAAGWVFLFLLFLILVIWAVAYLVPFMGYRKNLRRVGQVFIGNAGLYRNGSVHTWKFPGSRLESVQFMDKPFPYLEFVYSYIMLAGRSLHAFRHFVPVRVPVPEGKETEGLRIAEKFRKKIFKTPPPL